MLQHRRGRAILALAFLGFGAPVGWRVWLASSASAPPVAPPAPLPVEDDLELVAALFDAAPTSDAERDLLVAGGDDLFFARAADRVVLAVPKSGGPPRTLATLEGPVADMALAGGALWLSTQARGAAGVGGAQGRSGLVERLSLPGGSLSVVTTELSLPTALASDGEWVFVVDVNTSEAGLLPKSSVVRLPSGGGPPTVLGRSEGEIDAIALDGAFAYWTDRLDGKILSVPKTGGEPHALASERGLPEMLRAYDGALYWVERRSDSLWTMPATGGTPRKIAQDFAGFRHLVIDRRGAWWVNEAAVQGVFRVLEAPSGKGEELAASESVTSVDALTADGRDLYWAREGTVSRVAPPQPHD